MELSFLHFMYIVINNNKRVVIRVSSRHLGGRVHIVGDMGSFFSVKRSILKPRNGGNGQVVYKCYNFSINIVIMNKLKT